MSNRKEPHIKVTVKVVADDGDVTLRSDTITTNDGEQSWAIGSALASVLEASPRPRYSLAYALCFMDNPPLSGEAEIATAEKALLEAAEAYRLAFDSFDHLRRQKEQP